ncbi:MAG: hypothetical protein N3A69_13735, partial [Leptospiraceae bacterium]|nr:hypothetical protein [Leptospiraceae bacterium]
MDYIEFVKVYESLADTTKRLEKVELLSKFLKKLEKEGREDWIYLLRGRVFAEYDPREFGISTQLVIKAISSCFGVSIEKVVEKFRRVGDLGDVATEFAEKRKQSALFSNKLETKKVFDNLRKIVEVEGKGAVEKKIDLVVELLSFASGREARFLIRTLLGDLRIGVADALIIDALALAYFSGNREMREKIAENYDMTNDLSLV